jgi:hypothetical protein
MPLGEGGVLGAFHYVLVVEISWISYELIMGFICMIFKCGR